jgi:hypothetical protein
MNETDWVLLWSQRGNNLHIEQLSRTLRVNRQNYRDNVSNDYQIIAMGDRKHVDEIADSIRGTMKKREGERLDTSTHPAVCQAEGAAR